MTSHNLSDWCCVLGRPPNAQVGERPCVCGSRCVARVVAKMRYGPRTKYPFVMTEFLTPLERATFEKGGGLPARKGKCLLCIRCDSPNSLTVFLQLICARTVPCTDTLRCAFKLERFGRQKSRPSLLAVSLIRARFVQNFFASNNPGRCDLRHTATAATLSRVCASTITPPNHHTLTPGGVCVCTELRVPAGQAGPAVPGRRAELRPAALRELPGAADRKQRRRHWQRDQPTATRGLRRRGAARLPTLGAAVRRRELCGHLRRPRLAGLACLEASGALQEQRLSLRAQRQRRAAHRAGRHGRRLRRRDKGHLAFSGKPHHSKRATLPF